MSYEEQLCLKHVSQQIITPHMQRERDKMIGVGVHIYNIGMFVDKI